MKKSIAPNPFVKLRVLRGWFVPSLKWLLLPALAAAIALSASGQPAHAQVSCVGFGFRQMGNTIYGSPSGDLIDCANSSANLVIFGMDGHDVIVGGAGNDILMGGNGVDFIFSRQGNDFLAGGADTDLLFGTNGDDYLAGGDDGDLLLAGNGDDLIQAGPGNDILIGGAGFDVCDGQEGDNDLASGNCEVPINISIY